jgi:hypothetical protein
MSDMADSMPDHDEQPVDKPLVESIPYELVHAHDHPELVSDVVLDTDSPDIVLSKKALENEGGALESAYVVEETSVSEAEFSEAHPVNPPAPDTLPETSDKMVWDNEGSFDDHGNWQPFAALDQPEVAPESAETSAPLEATEPIEPLARRLSADEWRLQELNDAIERYPNTPTNYVLRGEVYLAFNQHALAAADFKRALDLAEARLDGLPWGYATAAFIDRARIGLRRVRS